jgi:hypothetical protein
MNKAEYLIDQGVDPVEANGNSPCEISGELTPNWALVNVGAEDDEPKWVATKVRAALLAPVQAELEAMAREEQRPAIEAALIVEEINRTRDQLIEGGFSFAGDIFQSRQSDRENIAAMGQLAKLAVAAGSPAGNLRWAYPDQDFAFITATNAIMPMDAQTMSALFDRGVSFKAGLTFYARALKDAVIAAETLEEKRAIVAGAEWPLEPPEALPPPDEEPPESDPDPEPEPEPDPDPDPETPPEPRP